MTFWRDSELVIAQCPVCRAEYRDGAEVCPRCGRQNPTRLAVKVIRVVAGVAIVLGTHWFFAAGTVPRQVASLAALSAGIAVIVATFARNRGPGGTF